MYCILLGVYAIYEHLRSFVRAFMRVCLCSHVRNCIHACNSVSKNEPPLVKADYGPEDYTDAPYLWSMFGW